MALKSRTTGRSFARFYRQDAALQYGAGAVEQRFIDLRSDTVTRPSASMRASMAAAEVGDDVYGEDPTVQRLQRKAAAFFGKEAALFVPTGTMSNLIAVMSHCRSRGEEIIVGHKSHLYLYEQGGAAQIAGVHPRAVRNREDGTLDLEEVRAAVREDDPHYPRSRLLCLENTHNACGGRVLPPAFLAEAAAVAREAGLRVHLDGARLFNALAEYEEDAPSVARHFDSISICLSKGLGAPVGSLLIGDADLVSFGLRLRKVLGGGMRQAGVVAAAGEIAFDAGPERLVEDHRNAKIIAYAVASLSSPLLTIDPRSVESNIVICKVNKSLVTPAEISARLEAVSGPDELAVLISGMSATDVRFVTHVDVSREDVVAAAEKIKRVVRQLEKEKKVGG